MADDPKKPAPGPGPEPDPARSGRPTPPDGDIRVVDKRWWAKGGLADDGTADIAASTKPLYVEELEQRLAAKDEELRATIARYRDANAEFEQARVRVRRDVSKDVERGRRAILADLLDVVDNLDRAVDAARENTADRALLQGVEMVRQQFLAKLDGHGVRPVPALHEMFNPAVHEAATTVPVSTAEDDGRIVGVIRQGYAIGDDVLRPAVVAVARFNREGAQS